MKIDGIQIEIARVCSPASVEQVQMLSEAERCQLEGIKNLERKQTFVAGRMIAKRLIARIFPEASPAEINIRTRNQQRQGICPQVEVGGQVWNGSLSISHTTTWALAAVAEDACCRVGVDIVPIEPRPASFVRTWFTARERNELHSEDPVNVAIGWAAKEAAYKALNRGEGFRPRELHVSRSSESVGDVVWGRLRCQVYISMHGDHVVAVAIANQPATLMQSA
jgi:4'-phosphopantetheinyl transferase EntD